ncbi:MAG TPA: cation transporter, partial [Calditrichaeota bacterium]|nr:cation transporter [Calditrichota bacterium]
MSAKSDMIQSTFRIAKMDCPSEENMIRLKLGHLTQITTLEFDIPNRLLHVYHSKGLEEIDKTMEEIAASAADVLREKTKDMMEKC